MSYHEERLQQTQQIARFAEKGFMAEVREIAEALSICPMGDVKAIAERLMLSVEIMKSIEDDIEYYRKRCEEEQE
jgi:hypothetical protein